MSPLQADQWWKAQERIQNAHKALEKALGTGGTASFEECVERVIAALPPPPRTRAERAAENTARWVAFVKAENEQVACNKAWDERIDRNKGTLTLG